MRLTVGSGGVSGNGADIGAVYQAIIALSTDMRAMRSEMNARFGAAETELRGVRAELKAEIADLRQTLREYHGAVVGHGILLTEHDGRITRLEQGAQPS